jgi:hypothetical protein
MIEKRELHEIAILLDPNPSKQYDKLGRIEREKIYALAIEQRKLNVLTDISHSLLILSSK